MPAASLFGAPHPGATDGGVVDTSGPARAHEKPGALRLSPARGRVADTRLSIGDTSDEPDVSGASSN